jgi:alginate O-acetyltransferase complex protein AlgI
MTLSHILYFGIAALVYNLLIPSRWRGWVLMVGSVVAVYWLQPALQIRRLDFFLPTLTLTLTMLIWVMTRQREQAIKREDWTALALVAGLVFAISLTRYLIPELRPTPSRPPDVVTVLLILAGIMLLFMGLGRLAKYPKILLPAFLLLMIGLFVVLKTESLAEQVSRGLREFTGQSINLASPADLQWLGFSYVAFRLIHLLRDRQSGLLPDLTLREHITYVIFFPALTAGPIDRAERFVEDDRKLAEMGRFEANRWTEGLTRIAAGVFKKFALADTLALVALNSSSAEQATSQLGLWVLLYGYAFQLYLDFSGYSDIAIGLGILFGVKLPENFDRPYLKNSITAFWQSWHISLSNWVRFYVFSPLSRSLLRMKRRPSSRMIVFITQLATMITIGLWHGITLNFLIWGLWHGVGLFIHKVWSDQTRRYTMQLPPTRARVWTVAGVLITFHYVVLGWIWFSLSSTEQANDVFLRMVGLR